MDFGNFIHNIMEREVVFHLRNPTCWVWTIKFVHIHFREVVPCVSIHKGGFTRTQERVWKVIFTLLRGLLIMYIFPILSSLFRKYITKIFFISCKSMCSPLTLVERPLTLAQVYHSFPPILDPFLPIWQCNRGYWRLWVTAKHINR